MFWTGFAVGCFIGPITLYIFLMICIRSFETRAYYGETECGCWRADVKKPFKLTGNSARIEAGVFDKKVKKRKVQ